MNEWVILIGVGVVVIVLVAGFSWVKSVASGRNAASKQ